MTLSEKREELRRRLLAESNKPQKYELSLAQKRFWFLEQFVGQHSPYLIASVISIQGHLNQAILGKCLRMIQLRHEVLRSRIGEKDGIPFQVVTKDEGIPFCHENLESVPSSVRRTTARKFVEEKASVAIDLKNQLPWDCLLVKVFDDEWILLLRMHHILCDGWSMRVFWGELTELYENYQSEKSPNLKPLPIAYSDYVNWQKEMVNKGAFKADLDYWKKKLNPVDEPLALPLDYPRPPVQCFKGKRHHFKLERDVTEQCKTVAMKHDVSLFVLLLSAYKLFLIRHTGQLEISVGIPVVNRNQAAVTDLIGLFTNTVVLRSQIDECQSISKLMRNEKKVLAGAQSHGSLPFSLLVDELKPERNPSYNPLFQTMFIMQVAPKHSVKAGDVSFEAEEIDIGIAKFDLTLEFSETEGELNGFLEYNTDLFLARTIARLIQRFSAILRSVISAPEERVENVASIDQREELVLLNKWNLDCQRFCSRDTTFNTLFEEQIVRHKDKTSAVCGGLDLTYNELDQKVEHLAARLSSFGAGRGDLVGICLDRSLDMLVAVLAVMRSGAAYVPLDPSFPDERLRYMLKDSDLKLVLIHKQTREILNLEGLDIDSIDVNQFLSPSDNNPLVTSPLTLDTDVTASDLAYIIYTSGSIGRPKGVQIEHQALVNFLQSMAREPGLNESDRLLSVTTLSFDISILELLLPLTVGATVVIAEQETVYDGNQLSETLIEHGITVMQATPSGWRLLLDAGWEGNKDLKMFCGGEALPIDLAKQLTIRGGELWNMYGPTETTIWSSVWKVPASPQEVLVGLPIDNTQFFVLDKAHRLSPLGVPGELYIGGDGLSRGYLRRAALNKKAFIQNPFQPEISSRLYRTGDLVCMREDGCLEFLGRTDHQVKIRGFRIELGEIEAVLESHPNVGKCVTIVREDEPGDKRIVAYMTRKIKAESNLEKAEEKELRLLLKDQLPSYMIPSAFVFLESFPETPNQKINRKAFPKPQATGTPKNNNFVTPSAGLESEIASIWKELLGLETVGRNETFFDLGGHSLLLPTLLSRLNSLPIRSLRILDIFKYPTIESLCEYIESDADEVKKVANAQIHSKVRVGSSEAKKSGAIAIVGMSCRFPGADNIDQFWDNLRNGRESVQEITEEQALAVGVDQSLLNNPRYVRHCGRLEGMDEFDASFFGIRPSEAELMDPQQRIFLQVVYHALEDSGCIPKKFKGRIGLFAGAGMSDYSEGLWQGADPSLVSRNYEVMISNDKDFLATRVAYRLGLTGPAITVQTACSTSLVATHLACESLLRGESDIALAGSVSLRLNQDMGYVHEEGMILSRDGRCCAFDEKATGTVIGSGAGVVALRSLEDAIANGDRIYSIIRGSAVNNDGSMKMSYTAPSPVGQSKAIKKAIENSGISSGSISYIEAHGTGTTLGDPIEIEALIDAFGDCLGQKQFCGVGSVKTNIGHLDTAAGVAGLIKTALCIHHRKLVPTIHYRKSNPKIEFSESPFYVVEKLSDWENKSEKLRAGVSSFGIGGTNAHIILEEAPKSETINRTLSVNSHLFVLSAKSKKSLAHMSDEFGDYLSRSTDIPLADVASTLRLDRPEYEHRTAFVATTLEEAIDFLRRGDEKSYFFGDTSLGELNIAFMFTGQGSQYVGMSSELYLHNHFYKNEVDICADILKPIIKEDIRELMFNSQTDTDTLNRTEFAQLALFVVEYALARLWMSWGCRPVAMIGHSIGEFAAACIAGVMSLEDTLRIVAQRARLMQSLPSGSMLATKLSEFDATQYASNSELSVAALNSPGRSVLSGPDTAIEKLKNELSEKGDFCRVLQTSHAFHSAMMDPILSDFEASFDGVELSPPEIPYVSNISGDWIRNEEATCPSYWSRHLRSTVRFDQGVSKLIEKKDCAIVEIGPGVSLRDFARKTASSISGSENVWIESTLGHIRGNLGDVESLYETVAKFWVRGLKVNWRAFQNGRDYTRVHLPLYVFEKKKFWKSNSPQVNKNLLIQKQKADDWFYAPVWKQAPTAIYDEVENQLHRHQVLILANDDALPNQLISVFAEGEHQITVVKPGVGFAREEEGYSIRIDEENDYRLLLQELEEQQKFPSQIIHCLNVTAGSCEGERHDLEAMKDASFFSLLAISKALSDWPSVEITLNVVSTGLHNVLGCDKILPEVALLTGPIKAISKEFPNIRCRSIDLTPVTDGASANSKDIHVLVKEMAVSPDTNIVAIRNGIRWVQDYKKLEMISQQKDISRLWKKEGVYYITGGLGGIGFEVAKFLANEFQAKLVLTGRSYLPHSGEFDDWIESHQRDNGVSLGIAKVRELESLGAQVVYIRADVGDPVEVTESVSKAKKIFSKIDGVIHSAGLRGGGIMLHRTREQANEILHPKVSGILALEEAFKAEPLDFMLLFSSIASIYGGFGDSDYAAANSFLNAYAQSKNELRDGKVISILWDVWNESDMAKRSFVKSTVSGLKDQNPLVEIGLRNSEGIRALNRVMDVSLPEIVVSVYPIDFSLYQAFSPHKGNVDDEHNKNGIKQGHKRPDLSSEYTEAETSMEKRVHDLVVNLFGFDKIGMLDDFFELGADSLVIVQLHSSLIGSIATDLTIADLYNFTNIRDLSKRIEIGSAIDHSRSHTSKEQSTKAKEALRRSREKKRMKRNSD